MNKTTLNKSLIHAKEVLVSPGIYDGYSIRLVEKLGFKAASTSGAGLTNALLGQPDMGIMGMMQNVDACRHLARSVSIPLMADADTGYGNAITVHHVVRYFEEAGVVGINIEDQTFPKRCGHMKGKELVHPLEMAKKIEAAVESRRDPDFVINARTDAIAVEGIDCAIERGKLYAKAGADMLFPDAVKDAEQIKRFVGEVGIPISINMGFGIRQRPTTPLMTMDQLGALGVARVTLPRMLPAAAIKAMTTTLLLMKQSIETGELIDRPDLLASIDEITSLVGYAGLDELEQRYSLDDDLIARYGSGPVLRNG